MGKKSDPPPPPDYTAAAEKSGESAQEAQTRADWANRPTLNTPWGQQTWSAASGIDPSTGKPITNWTGNITLSPEEQKSLDAQRGVQTGRSELAQGMLGRLGEAYAQPFDWNNMSPMGQAPQAGGWNGIPHPDQRFNGQQVRDWGSQGGPGVSAGGMGNIQAAGAGEGIQKQLDPSLYGDEGRQRIENAMMERMRPEHQQAQARIEAQLGNMGLTRGSEAWNREMQRLGDQQSRERFNALDRGLQEQQGQFGMALGAGNFANQAQQQGFGQNFQNAGLLAQQHEGAYGRGLQASMANAQNALGYAGLGQAGDIARTQLDMQGQNQFFNQQMQGQQLLGNQLNQNFNQGMQGADYANQLRQQQIAEQMMQRGMPLNELNALLTGQQVGMPQMPGFNASRSSGGVDYLGAANMGYNANLGAYNAGQAGSSAAGGGIGSLIGGVGGAMFGGPMGAMIGSNIGGAAGRGLF